MYIYIGLLLKYIQILKAENLVQRTIYKQNIQHTYISIRYLFKYIQIPKAESLVQRMLSKHAPHF